MSARRYEMGRGGGLVAVDVPANSLKNNLPNGTVLHWGGNMAWPAQDYAVIRRVVSDYNGEIYYHLIALDGYADHRIEAHSLKAKTEPGVWHSQHFFLTDKMLTCDEVLELVEKNKAKKRADEEQNIAQATAFQVEVARLKEKYRTLIPISETNQNHLTTAAKNLRKELRAKWPATKFRVTTQRYSGGDNMNVYWTDGPTSKAVDAVADKYQGKDFDGMTDSTSYRHNAWTEVF